MKRSERFVNRELSWLEFNQRVLDEAMDEKVPLLERLTFLAITASNLDEFFMVRVGGLQLLTARGVNKCDPSGMTPARQLRAIEKRARRMVQDQYAQYRDLLEPKLMEIGITRIRPAVVNEQQAAHLERFFEEEVFPVVTPMVATAASFPSLANLQLHVAVRLRPQAEGTRAPRYAVIPLGGPIRRFVVVPSADGGHAYMVIEDVVRMFADRFFPGQDVAEAVPFRITRNADLSAREDFSADFLAEMESVLTRRKRSDCVRLEIKQVTTRMLLTFLKRGLGIQDREVYALPGPMDLSAFMDIGRLEGHEADKYETWWSQPSPDVDSRKSMFEQLSRKTLLLLHPYESFDPVVRLVEEAAKDPDVLAIKQILYRTSKRSPIVAALQEAAERGKYVTVVVELKARFDEARNIEWARQLEEAGVQVIYGIRGLKTHAKVLIIVRREVQGIVRYLHFGTGNYNEKTARLYSDISYLTSDHDLGGDASAFFNSISGYSEPQSYLKLAAAPMGLRERLLELIKSETERKRQGQKALIMAKMNSLVDPQIIEALYEASRAGVKVLLNIRGICCLRPGVPGLSEKIRVVSIVDRFLEHSRICYFHQGGEKDVYISSADWMPRNLDRRIELLIPVDDVDARRRLTNMLETHFKDTVKGRVMLSDGGYECPEGGGRKKVVRSQEVLYTAACDAHRDAQHARRTVFEPHRPSKPET